MNSKSKLNLYALAAALTFAMVSPAYAAFDCFLKLDGIPGESRDTAHVDEIEVLSFSQGISNTGLSRADFTVLSVTKRLDKSSPILMLKCASGNHIPTAVLTCRRTTAGTPVQFYKITLTDVVITSVTVSGSATGLDSVPSEEASFSYGKIQWEYVPVDATGTPQTPVRAGWDLLQNKSI